MKRITSGEYSTCDQDGVLSVRVCEAFHQGCVTWEGLKTECFWVKWEPSPVQRQSYWNEKLHWGVARPGWGVGVVRGGGGWKEMVSVQIFPGRHGNELGFYGRAVESHWIILSRVAWSDIFFKRIVSKQLENGFKAYKCVARWVRVEARGFESRLLRVLRWETMVAWTGNFFPGSF